MSRQKYFMVVLPVSALVLGYLGYWLHEQHGVDYGPTGVGIAVIAILGLLLPPRLRPVRGRGASTPARQVA